MTIPRQFAPLYDGQVFVWSDCLLDLDLARTPQRLHQGKRQFLRSQVTVRLTPSTNHHFWGKIKLNKPRRQKFERGFTAVGPVSKAVFWIAPALKDKSYENCGFSAQAD